MREETEIDVDVWHKKESVSHYCSFPADVFVFCVAGLVTFSFELFPPVGDYEVSIRFNDEHIPDSPFIVPVASPSDDARRLTVASLQVRL